MTFRAPGILAKTVATLDVLSNGRAFCGLGAGWWLREHQAYGLDFPSDKARLDELQVCIETLRALWAPGTKAFRGRYVHLPETTCYPRPVGPVPIIVGGSGERRTLRIVAEQADGCNLPSGHEDPAAQDRDPAPALRRRRPRPGRGGDHRARPADHRPRPGGCRHPGRTAARAYAGRRLRRPALTPGWPPIMLGATRELADLGVGTVFLALPDLAGAEDLARCAPLLRRADG